MSRHPMARGARPARKIPWTLALAALVTMTLVALPAGAADNLDPTTTHDVTPTLQSFPDDRTCPGGYALVRDRFLNLSLTGTGSAQTSAVVDGATITVTISWPGTLDPTADPPTKDEVGTYDISIDGGTIARWFNKDQQYLQWDWDPAVSSDTRLHTSTVGNGKYRDQISHIDMCLAAPVFTNAVLSGTKTNSTTGTGIADWDIFIFEDATGTTQAPGSPVSTDLDGNWSYTTEDFQEGTSVTLYVCEEQIAGWEQDAPASGDPGTVDITGYGTCHVVTFTAGADDITIPGLNFANTALQALRIVKSAKHADTSGATSANLAVDVLVEGPDGFSQTVTTDATSGEACIDGLQPGAYTVTEQTPPTGYAVLDGTDAVTLGGTSPTTCDDDPFPADHTASIENVPLTDISWTVDSQHDGGTLTVVACYADLDDDGQVDDLLPGYPQTVGDGSGSLPNLLPTDPDVTVSCDFTVDP